MKLWYFKFSVDKEAFPDEKIYRKVENVKRTTFHAGLGDFYYLSDFFERHLELRLRSLKLEGLLKGISVDLSNRYHIENYGDSIRISIPFNYNKYKKLYPIPNLYPMTYDFNKIQHHVTDIDTFNNFILETTLDAFQYAEKQKLEIPFDFIKKELALFKQNNFKREWYLQKKSFKEKGISARLFCKQNCNEFIIELIILKARKEVFRKQIGKGNPDYFHYRVYGRLRILDNKLVVQKGMEEEYFSVDLHSLIDV